MRMHLTHCADTKTSPRGMIRTCQRHLISSSRTSLPDLAPWRSCSVLTARTGLSRLHRAGPSASLD